MSFVQSSKFKEKDKSKKIKVKTMIKELYIRI